MRYFVKAKVKPGQRAALLEAIQNRTLGLGSIAGGEYIRNMGEARQLDDGTVCWVEVCYCSTPLAEERPYWEEYFELTKVINAHARDKCKDLNGEEYWACSHCDCTEKLEATIAEWGGLFIHELQSESVG
jgi:hypothetical protein